MTGRSGGAPGRERGTLTEERSRLATPRKFRVLLLNDDYTTMEFVVMVLTRYFRLSMPDATAVMLDVHRRGRGVAGVYTRDVAESKAAQVRRHAREEGYPLELAVEPESGTGKGEGT